MKFVAPKKTLIDALSKVVGVTDKKSAMPILANVLVSAGQNVMFAASDMYQTVRCHIDVVPEDAGSVAIPAKDLLNRVKLFPDGDVVVTADADYKVVIKAVGSPRHYTLAGLPAADFPPMPKCHVDAPKLSWTAGDLRGLVSRVHFAMSSDETRPHINGMLIEATPGRLRLVTTDGHRLALAEMAWSHEAEVRIIVPYKAVHELRKLLAKDGLAETVELRVSGPTAFWSVAGVEFSTKLTDAQFPPYEQVVPAKSERQASVSRSALISAVKAVSVAADGRTGGIRFDFANGKARVSAQFEGNAGSDDVDVDYQSAPGFFGACAKYVIEAAGSFDEEDEIKVCFDGELDPIVFMGSKASTKSVVMPMRTT